MKKSIIAIMLSAALLAGCGGTASSTETNPETTPVAETSSEEGQFTADLLVYTNQSGRTFQDLVAHMDSSECTPDVLQRYYFNAYYPLYSQDTDTTKTFAYIIFDDYENVPEEYGQYVGCRLSYDKTIKTYVLLSESGHGTIDDGSGLCTPDFQCYFADLETQTIEFAYDVSDFDEIDMEYVVEW